MRKRILALFCAALCLFSLAACGGGSSPEARIERVLKTYYTCPDKKLLEMADEIDEAWGDQEKIDPLIEEYQAYLETVYKAEDFSEEFYHDMASRMVFLYGLVPVYCLRADATTKVKNIELVHNVENDGESIYSFTVEVELTQDGETKQVSDQGTVVLTDGVITKFSPHGQLLQELQ